MTPKNQLHSADTGDVEDSIESSSALHVAVPCGPPGAAEKSGATFFGIIGPIKAFLDVHMLLSGLLWAGSWISTPSSFLSSSFHHH